jgi:hypothetical protein
MQLLRDIGRFQARQLRVLENIIACAGRPVAAGTNGILALSSGRIARGERRTEGACQSDGSNSDSGLFHSYFLLVNPVFLRVYPAPNQGPVGLLDFGPRLYQKILN